MTKLSRIIFQDESRNIWCIYPQTKREQQFAFTKISSTFLHIDQSTLSKIETNQRQPTKEMIPILSKVFGGEL